MVSAAENPVTHSAIYYGWVRHRRYYPREHDFRYRVYMMYLDLDEIDSVCALSRLYSTTGPAPARFDRREYLDGGSGDLKQAVQRLVASRLGIHLSGPVRMLTNLRYFGYLINPITVYYCFDHHGNLQAQVLEVTNTPWRQRHCYVLACDPEKTTQRISFHKAMHVSPFHPMAMCYRLNSSRPQQQLAVHLQNRMAGAERVEFDATLMLEREDISPASLRRVLWVFPLMTMKVAVGIYWQALKLALKRVPFCTAPGSSEPDKKFEHVRDSTHHW